MIDPDSPLAELVATELAEEAPPSARALGDAIRRERSNVASILFYGSCLRKKTDDGVFDFYVLVDSYRVLAEKLGESDRHTAEVRSYLGELYRSLGKPESEIQERLLERR